MLNYQFYLFNLKAIESKIFPQVPLKLEFAFSLDTKANKAECALVQSSELPWNTFSWVCYLDNPIVSIFHKHTGSACSMINDSNTAPMWNLF